ncbi:hypothetical protein, partial [Streptomyces sp. NPDC006324]
PATCDALAELLGCTEEWAPAGGPPPGATGAALLSAHPDTCDALARLLGCDEPWAPVGAAPARRP